MVKTTFEFVQMDLDLPMRLLHFTPENLALWKRMEGLKELKDSRYVIPIHWHKEIEVTYVVRGKITVRNNKQTDVYQDGSFIYIESGEIHELIGEMTPDSEVICFIISYDFIKKHLPGIDNLSFDMAKTSRTVSELESLFFSILETYEAKEPFYNLKIQSDILSLFYVLCHHHLAEQEEGQQLKKKNTLQLNQQILSYIHDHYSERLTLEEVSSQFNFSREHFARLFKENFGRTFLTYLMDYRLYRAFPEIIQGNKTIEVISQLHGFPSSKALIRGFKATYDDTPIQYRKKQTIQIMDHNDLSK